MAGITLKRQLATQICTMIIMVSLAIVGQWAIADSSSAGVSADREQVLTHMLLHDCGSCHGMTLKGGLGPALLPEQFKDKNIDYIKLTILHGRNGTAMPPWKSIISEEDAQWLAEFLMSGRINELN